MNNSEQLFKSIYDIDAKFKNIEYIDNKTNTSTGYLVNLKDYEEYTNKNKLPGINNNNGKKLHQIQFKTSSYLINMILNGNKYIIIGPEIWNTIPPSEKEIESPIFYSKNISHIFIKLEDNITLQFSNFNNNNILDNNSYYKSDNPNYKSYYDIDKIYENIIKYNNYENKFSNDLKNSNKKLYKGYFLDKIWFDEWNNYTNYDYIKTNFLQAYIDKKSIIDNIILHMEKNKPKLNPMKLIDFKSKEEIINYLKNNSLVLLDNTLISSFANSPFDSKTYKFYLYNNNIEFESNKEIFFTVSSTNNIISLNNNYQTNINNNSNNNNDLFHLKILTKLYYFQKDLNKIIDLPYRLIQQDNNDIFILNKNILDKYKIFFDYNTLRECLIKIEINYNNFENEYLKIVNSIKQSKAEYLNNFNNCEKTFSSNFSFNGNITNFNIVKYNETLQLYFVENFEFVNEDIFKFFTQKTNFKNNEQIITSKYIIGDGRIFLVFNYNNQNFYEIGTIDKLTNNFIIEYLIKDANQLYKDIIFNNFKNYGINYIIQNVFLKANNNNIIFGNSLVGYFFKMPKQNPDTRVSVNINSSPKNNEYQELIINIFSFLLPLYSFESDLQNKKMEQKNLNNNSTYINNCNLEQCHLINGTVFSNLKKIISYQEFINIINKYGLKSSPIDDKFLNKMKIEKYYDIISSKIKDINDKNLFKIDTASFPDNKNANCAFYPINFNILNMDLYQKLIKFLKRMNHLII